MESCKLGMKVLVEVCLVYLASNSFNSNYIL